MKKIFAAFLCILMLAPSVVAHSGRTDGSGGHNSSSGYHYHHGYPAHDHYDIDGDGKADCPYDFRNKENGSSSSWPGLRESSRNNTTSTTPSGNLVTTFKRETYIPTWVYVVLVCSILLCIYFGLQFRDNLYAVHKLEKDIRAADSKHKNEIKEKSEQLKREERAHAAALREKNALHHQETHALRTEIYHEKEKCAELNNKLTVAKHIAREFFAEKGNQTTIEKIEKLFSGEFHFPPGVRFKDSLPILGASSDIKPFGENTVYFSNKASCYHTDRFCAGNLPKPAHLFSVCKTHRPCQKCVDDSKKSIPKWYSDIFPDK